MLVPALHIWYPGIRAKGQRYPRKNEYIQPLKKNSGRTQKEIEEP